MMMIFLVTQIKVIIRSDKRKVYIYTFTMNAVCVLITGRASVSRSLENVQASTSHNRMGFHLLPWLV
jgi:hypothetical protein